MKKYQHFISLGHFCSVASELERIGFRDCSSPFDWIISNWIAVETLIDNHFLDFLEYDSLEQHVSFHQYYKNKYGIHFFHDFDKYISLKKQLNFVQQKYNKRIENFYKNITEATLFIRYIADKEELEYLEKNYNSILLKLKKYNENNNIIFIANNNLLSNILDIYYVEKDPNDSVARQPFAKNKNLYNYLLSLNYPHRKQNLKILEFKRKREKNFFLKLPKKLKKTFRKILKKEYTHDKTYSF